MPITKLHMPPFLFSSTEELVDCGCSVTDRKEFDKTFQCLARGSLHRDVHCLSEVGSYDLGVTTKESKNFLSGDCVGNLEIKSARGSRNKT